MTTLAATIPKFSDIKRVPFPEGEEARPFQGITSLGTASVMLYTTLCPLDCKGFSLSNIQKYFGEGEDRTDKDETLLTGQYIWRLQYKRIFLRVYWCDKQYSDLQRQHSYVEVECSKGLKNSVENRDVCEQVGEFCNLFFPAIFN